MGSNSCKCAILLLEYNDLYFFKALVCSLGDNSTSLIFDVWFTAIEDLYSFKIHIDALIQNVLICGDKIHEELTG